MGYRPLFTNPVSGHLRPQMDVALPGGDCPVRLIHRRTHALSLALVAEVRRTSPQSIAATPGLRRPG